MGGDSTVQAGRSIWRWLEGAGRAALSADDGGPSAVGPSRRRHPRGTCSPHRGFGPRLTPSSLSRACLRLRASPGAPPPASLADGPLVARAAASAPRSWQGPGTVPKDRSSSGSAGEARTVRLFGASEQGPETRRSVYIEGLSSMLRGERCTLGGRALRVDSTERVGRQAGRRQCCPGDEGPTARDAGGGAPGLARSRRHARDLSEGVRRGSKPRCGEHVPRGCRRREGPTADGPPSSADDAARPAFLDEETAPEGRALRQREEKNT